MRRVARLTAPLLLASLAVAGCDVVAGMTATNQLTPFVKPPQVDGATVTLTWSGSGCVELRRALVEESEEDVRIELRTRETRSDCDESPVERTAVIELDAPLGDRVLVDAVCLQPEFGTHVLCPGEDAG